MEGPDLRKIKENSRQRLHFLKIQNGLEFTSHLNYFRGNSTIFDIIKDLPTQQVGK